MTTYNVHFGFDWNSYKIGTPWRGSVVIADYWLQYVLTSSRDDTQAHLFTFTPSDTLNFQIWDLTNWGQNTPGSTSTSSSLTLQGGVGANSLDGRTIYGSTDNVLAPSWQCAWGTFQGDKTKPYINFTTPISMNYTSNLVSPWGPASGVTSGSSEGDPVIANVIIASGSESVTNYKMNFMLQVTYGGTTQVFIGDPEVYIGSGKN